MTAEWIASEDDFRFQSNDFEIRINPRAPGTSLRISRGDRFIWEALSLTPQPKHSLIPEEIYTRQHDLIARFAQSEKDQFAFQIDWRVLAAEAPFVVGLEVWISLQTQLLDTSPSMQLISSGEAAWQAWPGRQAERGDEGIPIGSPQFDHRGAEVRDRVQRNSDSGDNSSSHDCHFGPAPAALHTEFGDLSGLWLIDPRDQGQVSMQSEPTDRVQRATLFGEFLEKGVIRRARMQFLVATGPLNDSEIEMAHRQLVERDLPLTA
jgi:hypothetical protein